MVDELDQGLIHGHGHDYARGFVEQVADAKTVDRMKAQRLSLWWWHTSFGTRKKSLSGAVVAAGAAGVDVAGTSTAHRMTYGPEDRPKWMPMLMSTVGC